MKLIYTIIIVSLLSCANQQDFIYGTWEIGEHTGTSQFIFSDEIKLTCRASQSSIIDNVSFEIVVNQKDKVSIWIPEDEQNSLTN